MWALWIALFYVMGSPLIPPPPWVMSDIRRPHGRVGRGEVKSLCEGCGYLWFFTLWGDGCLTKDCPNAIHHKGLRLHKRSPRRTATAAATQSFPGKSHPTQAAPGAAAPASTRTSSETPTQPSDGKDAPCSD